MSTRASACGFFPTRESLAIAWGRYSIASSGDNLHFAFRSMPAFLAHLRKLQIPASARCMIGVFLVLGVADQRHP
jgi:hypothetical protein